MFFSQGRGVLIACLVFFLAVAWSAPVWAQAAGTGAMLARAEDPDGRALPGVLVFLEGPLGTNTQHTGIDGNARILGLAPGFYTLTFSLDGFKTIIRERLRINVGRTIQVTVAMELSSVEETITVTGNSPVVDVRGTTVGSLYTADLISMTPTASGIWAGVLDHVPGVITNEIDVGGGESGQQAGFRAFGSVGNQNQYKINGIAVTDPVATSSSAMAYVSIGSFEEIGVETASHDVEMQGPGVMLNMVVKSGSNDWRGATKIFYENKGMVSNNVDQALEDAGVGAGNPNTLLRDVDVQLGGPILRDRAWFFVDYWNFKVERLLVGVPATDPDDTQLTDWTLNGTVQLSDNNKLSLRYLTGRKFRGNRGASRTEDPARARNQDSFKDTPQIQWQSVLGQNTFLVLRFGKLDLDFPLVARHPNANPLGAPGRNHAAKDPHPNFQDIPYTDDRDDTGLINLNHPGDDQIGWPSSESNNLRDRTDFHYSVSHYLGGANQSHDLKFGGEYMWSQEFNPRNRPFGLRQELDTIGGVPLTPSRVRLYNQSPIEIFDAVKGEGNGEVNNGIQYALYVQDAWTFRNRMTVNLGVRWDWSKSYYPDQTRGVSLWPQLGPEFQEEFIPAFDPVSQWSDLSPRLGIIYDLMGDGRTALKASYSRYSEWQATDFADTLNPAGTTSFYYNWSDTNNDGRFQFGEQTRLRSKSIAGLTFEYDETLKSPLTDEFTAGVEHELMEDFLVSAMYIWRDRKNNIEEINIGEPYGPIAETLGVQSQWTPIEVQDPGPDGVYGTADDGQFMTIWAHPLPLNNRFLITNPEKFGFDQKWGFNGIQVIAQKRWSDNWQLLASYNWGRALIFDDVGDNPNRDIGRDGVLSSYDRPHMIKVTGNYLFAAPIGVNVGLFLKMYSGQGRIREYRFRRSDWPELVQGNTTIRVAPRRKDELGPQAYDWVKMLDLRAEKQFAVGRYGVMHIYFDVFNVLNVNTVTAARGRSGSRFGEINNIIPPRVIRLGGAWDF
ncbi:MAG: TonB-dependent receptor [Acidobacteria bacterium]|nr:TonB-dependent receptor [Acidobacteriota bacterium]